MPQKLIFDTDPGIDDTIALFLALRSPELEVVGATTIFGNVPVDVTTQNALRLLEIAGRADIPVAAGAHRALGEAYQKPIVYVHGEDGQGNTHLPPPASKPLDITAPQFLVHQIMTQPKEITLVAVGVLTNLALALLLEPRIAEQVREVIIMGGNAFSVGNITPAAEANIYHDPDAADMVFGAGWPVTMVGLDVTQHVIMETPHLERLQKAQNPLAQHIARIVPHYWRMYESFTGHSMILLHDPTAVAYAINPKLFQTAAHPIRVDRGGIGRGKTWAMTLPGRLGFPTYAPWRDRPLVNICVGVDAAGVLDLVLDRLC